MWRSAKTYPHAPTISWAAENPTAGVPRLKVPPPEVFPFWDREQSATFLATMLKYEPQWHPLFFTALRTGLRQGELLGLRKDDVDFVKREIRVWHCFTEGRPTTPKSDKQPWVNMSDELAEVLG